MPEVRKINWTTEITRMPDGKLLVPVGVLHPMIDPWCSLPPVQSPHPTLILNHDLHIANLHVYGFDQKALLLIKCQVSNRWQRTKINVIQLMD